jgi:integrase
MRDAVRSRYIRTNPLDAVKLPKDRRLKKDVLSPGDVRNLLDACRGSRYGGIIVLGAAVGLRVGEALALCCDDVDFNTGTITIRHTLWHGDVHPPKTPTSRRTLKLPQIALEALRRACKGRTGYIFATSNGTPLDALTSTSGYGDPC